LEYADGGDLLDKIVAMASQRRQLPFSQVRRYFIMVAKGLSCIHKEGISHLDISMENILITKTDELKICDFGQSEIKRIVKDENLKRGKPKYMSPEVYEMQKYDGFKADIWSLGVILWGMLTGGLLYRKASPTDERFAFLTKGEEGIRELLQIDEVYDVPNPIIHMLSRLLDINPKTRYLIEDVLNHPWLKLPKPKVEVAEEKTPLTITPPRPLRTFAPIQSTSTPTEKNISPKTSKTALFPSESKKNLDNVKNPTEINSVKEENEILRKCSKEELEIESAGNGIKTLSVT